MTGSKGLWAGAAALTFGLFCMKQYLWNEVSGQVKDLRTIEHVNASKELNAAYERAKGFTLSPLSPSEISKMQHLKAGDISKFSLKNPSEVQRE